ncbi:MAG: hypothetical protein AAGC60_29875 [Acidobacteriota bacterium]
MLWRVVALVVLCLVHLLGHRLRAKDPRRQVHWLSVGSGVSVAYVFLMLLPELSADAAEVDVEGWFRVLYDHPHFVAMLGLLLFYGLDRLIRLDERRLSPNRASVSFALDIGSFMLYNAIVGHLIVEHTTDFALFWYAVAMSLHFLVVDRGLRESYGADFQALGRWLLVGALALGFATSFVFEHLLNDLTPLLTAFLGGGVILNTLNDELPESRESHFGMFCTGALVYAGVVVLV